MQKILLEYLRCPVNKQKLRVEIITTSTNALTGAEEIESGLLHSESGFIYPIVNCVPRMLVEAVYEHKAFLNSHLEDYADYVARLEHKHATLLQTSKAKNARTKSSFGFEWSLLDTEQNDKLWHDDLSDLQGVLLKEFALPARAFAGKLSLDAGCGHGLMTGELAKLGTTSIGIELSRAIDQAYARNKEVNAHFVQADVQLPPFETNTFDLLYSSGVLHHTNDTYLSLSRVHDTLKKAGRLSIWLYHPQKNLIHNMLQLLRSFFNKLPIKLSFVLIAIFIFPVSYLTKKIRGKRKVNAREEMIDLLDGFTPEHREEVPHDKAQEWLRKLECTEIAIACTDQFGFSIVAKK